MKEYVYTTTPNSNLVCPICRVPFTDPCTTRTCAHTFCRECIFQALRYAPQCPIDRSPLSSRDIVPSDPIIRTLVDELLVKCVHKDCTQTVQRQLLAGHVRDECEYTQITCPDAACSLLVSRKDSKLDKCIHLEEQKTETWPLDIPLSTPCPHSNHGCSWEGRDVSSHLSVCSYETLPTSPFFALNDVRIAALSDQNYLLKNRVDVLEGIIQNMGREMAAVKSALGPWYRQDILVDHVNMRSTSAELSLETQPLSAGPSTPNNPITISGAPPPSTSILEPSFPSSVILPSTLHPIQDPEALASYFPPEEQPTRALLNLDHRSHSSFDSSSYIRPVQPLHTLQHQQPTPHYQIPVAPLNLSSSLPGTLASLRESVVGISTAVDGLARRNELALTSEALRLNEEVMGLRANLHGLRMQVHAMMVDRNAQATNRTENMANNGIEGWFRNSPSITKL